MSRERKRAARRAQQAEEIRREREIARLTRESIEAGAISALTWHGELPWTEQEHRQLMAVEVEARAQALYEADGADREWHEPVPPWHHLPTHERMRYRSAAYTVAQVEVGWAL